MNSEGSIKIDDYILNKNEIILIAEVDITK